jgi:hypothetical protein
MPQIGAGRGVGWKFVVAVLAVAGTLVFVGLAAAGVLPTTGISSQWTERTVSVTENTWSCYYVNSSAGTDYFCLVLFLTPGGPFLNGTFQHGPGTVAIPFTLGYGPCHLCPTGETWTSPDGTGQVYWTFTDSVTLRALN